MCAALGGGSALLVNRFGGTGWSGWASLGVTGAARPTCTGLGAGRVLCGVRNLALQFVVFEWNGSRWSAPVTVGGSFESGPQCALLTTGKAICAGRTLAGVIASLLYSGATWSSAAWSTLATLAGPIYSSPDCTSDAAGHAICAYLTGNSATAVREFNGTTWNGALNVGGAAKDPPRCTDAGVGGKVACFATGEDIHLYGSAYDGLAFTASHWSPYGSLGGLVAGFSCTQDGQKAGQIRYVCGATAVSLNTFFTNEYDGANWLGWTSRGGNTYGNPSCFALNRTTSPGRVMCVVRSDTGAGLSFAGP